MEELPTQRMPIARFMACSCLWKQYINPKQTNSTRNMKDAISLLDVYLNIPALLNVLL